MRRLSCALLALLALLVPPLSGEADAAPTVSPPRCGTVERLPAARHAPRPPRIFLGGGEKQTRDGFGGGHEVHESANFAVKWTSAALSQEEAELVADILEESWALYIDELGHTVPAGAEQFRINAYVSSETDNPAIDYDGGYAYLDDEGYTYLVISANIFAEEPFIDRLYSVLSHEFYHDIQFGTNAYQAESAYWYWEATAEWASQQLYPDLDAAYTFVGAYALATELPVFYEGDPFGDSPSGVHQYGASIFARHLTDRLELPSLVPESWEAAGAEDDPLEVLDGLLPGGDIAAAYIEFAPHMALWDFTGRDLILPWIETYTALYPAIDPLASRIGPEGTGGWVTVPAGREPRAFGASIIEIARPESGELDLAVEVDAVGSLGTPGRLAATVVRQADGIEYAPVTLERGAGAAHLTLAEGESSAYLVVAATADTRSPDETFSYRLRVAPEAVPEPEPEPEQEAEQPEPSPEPEQDEGGGCATGGSTGGSTGVGFAVLIALISLRLKRNRLMPLLRLFVSTPLLAALALAACISEDDRSADGVGAPDGDEDGGSDGEGDEGEEGDGDEEDGEEDPDEGSDVGPCASPLFTVPGADEVAVDAEHVYALSGNSEVYRFDRSKPESQPALLAQLKKGDAQRLLMDDEFVWVYGLALHRLDKSSGEVTEFARNLWFSVDSKRGVAVDESHVYWMSMEEGEIARRTKTGGAVETILPLDWDVEPLVNTVEDFALLGESVFFSLNHRILYRMDKDGGNRVELGAPLDGDVYALTPRGDGLLALAILDDTDPLAWAMVEIGTDGVAGEPLVTATEPFAASYQMVGDDIVFRDIDDDQGAYALDLVTGAITPYFRGPVAVDAAHLHDGTVYAVVGGTIYTMPLDAAEPHADPAECE